MRVVYILRKNGVFTTSERLSYFDMDLLNSKLTQAYDIQEADIFICRKEVPEGLDPKRVILIQSEPPVAHNIVSYYKRFKEYHHVFCFNPIGGNQSFITENPLTFPYSPAKKYHVFRENLSMTGRGYFFAGMRGTVDDSTILNEFGHGTIYALRAEIADQMKRLNSRSMILGRGFGEDTRSGSWRVNKYADIDRGDNDFVFCCENAIYTNYVSEKIHDGFNSDRVVCYLGEPNIEKYVPSDVFIDMRKYVSKQGFDVRRFVTAIQEIDQTRYERYIYQSREFRENLMDSHVEERIKISHKLIEVVSKFSYVGEKRKVFLNEDNKWIPHVPAKRKHSWGTTVLRVFSKLIRILSLKTKSDL